jgi:hypothetical protein
MAMKWFFMDTPGGYIMCIAGAFIVFVWQEIINNRRPKEKNRKRFLINDLDNLNEEGT